MKNTLQILFFLCYIIVKTLQNYISEICMTDSVYLLSVAKHSIEVLLDLNNKCAVGINTVATDINMITLSARSVNSWENVCK